MTTVLEPTGDLESPVAAQNGLALTQALARPIEHPRVIVNDVPRIIGRRTPDELFAAWGAGLASLALVWLLYYQIFPTSGLVGFVILWAVAYVGLYALITSLSDPGPAVKDRVASSLFHLAAGLVAVALLSAVIFTFYKGAPALSHPNFFLHDAKGVGPLTPLTKGGITHAIYGTVLEMSIAVAICLPLGVGTAVYMVEFGGRFARVIRTIVEAMTALPSIVAGLFVYSVWIVTLGHPKTGLAASFALSVMILPIIARASDVVLRVVPGGLREASLALGASKWQTVWKVVLPTARSGLATALILGIARGIGETSPVLLTSGANSVINYSPFSGQSNSLPLYVYTNYRSGQNLLEQRAFGAASVLLALVLLLFVITRLVARQRTSR